MRLSRLALLFAAIAGASAVMLGAFGAHALRGTLDATALATWHTAVDYQFWHALALIGAALLARDGASTALRISVFALAIGIVLFSASLYALALGAPHAIGVVTPFGGVALIVGWIALFVEGVRRG